MKISNIKIHQVTLHLEVRENIETGYNSIFATKKLELNSVVSTFNYNEILKKPTRFTIQLNDNQHFELQPEHLRYTNHSCNPNVFFDTKKMELVTLRQIEAGEELAFFYPSTEWKMDEPFNCGCGNSNCLGKIGGTFYLTPEDFEKYKLSDFVIQKYRALKGMI